jgi:hypothetical protein
MTSGESNKRLHTTRSPERSPTVASFGCMYVHHDVRSSVDSAQTYAASIYTDAEGSSCTHARNVLRTSTQAYGNAHAHVRGNQALTRKKGIA